MHFSLCNNHFISQTQCPLCETVRMRYTLRGQIVSPVQSSPSDPVDRCGPRKWTFCPKLARTNSPPTSLVPESDSVAACGLQHHLLPRHPPMSRLEGPHFMFKLFLTKRRQAAQNPREKLPGSQGLLITHTRGVRPVGQ